MLTGFRRRVDHNAELTRNVSRLHPVEKVGIQLWDSLPHCNCKALLNPRKKKKKKWFLILKRMATSDLLGRTGASDTCVTTQSGGECGGGKGSTSYSAPACVSNHCWGQGLVLWASRVIENYWPLWQATWPCLPLGSWHFSLVQDSTAVAYPSTACLESKMVRAEQTRSEQQCREIYVPPQLKQLTGN